MPRLKKSSAATRALNAAIAEATAELHDTVKQKDAEIGRLHGVIRQIISIAAAVPLDGPRPPVVEHRAPPPEVAIPQGPAVPLADEDGMGEGRWA